MFAEYLSTKKLNRNFINSLSEDYCIIIPYGTLYRELDLKFPNSIIFGQLNQFDIFVLKREEVRKICKQSKNNDDYAFDLFEIPRKYYRVADFVYDYKKGIFKNSVTKDEKPEFTPIKPEDV